LQRRFLHLNASTRRRIGKKLIKQGSETMSRTLLQSVPALAVAAAGLLCLAPQPSAQTFIGTPAPPQFAGQGQPSTRNGEWPANGADVRFTRYSPLDQINASNFSKLDVAWRFKTDAFGPYPEYKLEGTPIMVKGVLYTTAGTRRSVIALDARTGELIWSHSLREGERAAKAARQLSGRGVSYWTDGRGDDRIIYVTTGYRLVELNARTGAVIPSFADNGILDLKAGVQKGNNEQIDLEGGEIGTHAAPTVTGDVVILGSSMREGATVPTHNNTKGVVRAYDVRTGRQLWRFDTIPRPGEFGNETWENNSWVDNGNTGVWAHITVDEELGLVYIPVETPSSDYYGGHRPGANLFAESLVAVDLKTGVRRWHFQFVHHPIWNWDMTSAPILSDINVNGRAVKAVSVASKQGWLYVFDRVTGEPVWPIVEKPVPQSDVPGEKTSPTQPFPPDALQYARNYLDVPDDLIDFTPELKQKALDYLKRYKVVPSPFAPGVLGDVNGILGAIVAGTATNWPGFGYDPETHTAFLPAGNTPGLRSLVAPPGEFSDIRYVQGVAGQQFREVIGPGDCCAAGAPQTEARARVARTNPAAVNAPPPAGGFGGLNVDGLPIVKPPYGVLAAIDLDKGQVKWRTPHGDTPDQVRNHAALKGVDIPKTGQAQTSGVGLVITKTLVIMGDPITTTTPEHPRGAMLRAYDKTSGQQAGAVFIPAPQSGNPMTYMTDGKQYIVVAISGGSYSGEYIAFRLPD
jgi:quinoprotein glucose dehydrogenase